MGFSVGEKCLESGFYDYKHEQGPSVDLIIFEGETFPTCDGNDKIIWFKVRNLFRRHRRLAKKALRKAIGL